MIDGLAALWPGSARDVIGVIFGGNYCRRPHVCFMEAGVAKFLRRCSLPFAFTQLRV